MLTPAQQAQVTAANTEITQVRRILSTSHDPTARARAKQRGEIARLTLARYGYTVTV